MSNLENENTTKDRMGLVQALQVLHAYRDFLKCDKSDDIVVVSLDVIFEWIDNMILLLHKMGGGKDEHK